MGSKRLKARAKNLPTHWLNERDNAGVLLAIQNVPAVDAVEVGSCEGCHWKEIGRQQKCSCCRRNRYLKDCYEAKMEG